MAIEQKVVMPELKKLIEFNFKVDVHLIADGCYEENPMLVGDTKETGKTNFEDRFDIEYYSDNFSINTFGVNGEHILCKDIQSVLLYLKIKFKFKTNTIFLDLPESN